MNLLSFASKQIWPHVLSVAHLKPSTLILLHSNDVDESKRPAERLRTFLSDVGLLPRTAISLVVLPHDDFAAVQRDLEAITESRKLDLENSVLNFTGGNKLMATAGFGWANRRLVRACYLERGNKLVWFEPRNSEFTTRTEEISTTLLHDIDPLPLLRCQLDASEVERVGERITLSDRGLQMSEADVYSRVQNGTPVGDLLDVVGEADHQAKAGDALELSAAAILLKLGVKQIRRSLRLKVKSTRGLSTRKPHAELDLLFNWAGRLWLVDCKDRKAPDQLAEAFRRELRGIRLPHRADELLNRIQSELTIGQTKILKEDIIAMREMGGLLGKVVCLRKSSLGEEVHQFAASQNIEVVLKSEIVPRFESLLFPNRPASVDAISKLKGFTSGRVVTETKK